VICQVPPDGRQTDLVLRITVGLSSPGPDHLEALVSLDACRSLMDG
jgi:hypothetical protein